MGWTVYGLYHVVGLRLPSYGSLSKPFEQSLRVLGFLKPLSLSPHPCTVPTLLATYLLGCSGDLVSRLGNRPYRACYGLLWWLKGDTK